MSTTCIMESVTFPQPAGEILIRPVSEASIRSGWQTESEVEERRSASVQDNRLQPSPPLPLISAPSTRKQRQQLHIITDLKRGAPGDPNWQRIAQRSPEQARAAKQKSRFYGDMLANREPIRSVRERASKDSMITAEVKTNVIIRDEYSFLTTVSAFLAQRYARPESSIAITLQHSTCVLLAGSFDPAYIMTLSALPELVTPTLNKRNAALIQMQMTDSLAVPADRGVVKFVPVPESCLATNGTTLLADMDAEAKKARTNTSAPATSPWRSQLRERWTSPTAGKGEGAGPGNTGAAANMAGAAEALVGAAGSLFGRKKDGDHGLKAQEKKSLLKGKGVEHAADTGIEHGNNGNDDDIDGFDDGGEVDNELDDDRFVLNSRAGAAAEPYGTPAAAAPQQRRRGTGSYFGSRKSSSGGGGSVDGKEKSRFRPGSSSKGGSSTITGKPGSSGGGGGSGDLDEERRIEQARAMLPALELRTSADEQAAEEAGRVGKRKSFLQLFGR